MDKIKFKHGPEKIMRAVGIGTGKLKVEAPGSLTRLRYKKGS
jgi:hypothetical protein